LAPKLALAMIPSLAVLRGVVCPLAGLVILLCATSCCLAACVRSRVKETLFSARSVKPKAKRSTRLFRDILSTEERMRDELEDVADGEAPQGISYQHARRGAMRDGILIRAELRNPKFTRADYQVALERAGKRFDEVRVERNYRHAWKSGYVNYCAAAILTPTATELEAVETLTSWESASRRRAAELSRTEELSGLRYVVAKLLGLPTVCEHGAESPKAVA